MIEFRIYDGINWGDTPIFATVNAWRWSTDCTKRAALANEVARFFSGAFDCEVRWNHEGSLQGHYVSK